MNRSGMGSRGQREDNLQSIETIILRIIDDIVTGRHPSLEPKCNKTGQLKSVRFTSRATRKTFTLLVYLLEKIYNNLDQRMLVTQRDMYYENMAILGKQETLIRGLGDICSILQTTRSSLNIEVTAKGLVAGNLTWFDGRLKKVDVSLFSQSSGMLVPTGLDSLSEFKSRARFILIVEKDAIFQRLLYENVFDVLGPFILLTGKGYADLATLKLLSKLSRDFRIPSFALVDADPYGIEIAANLKWGSRSALYSEEEMAEITVPDLIWLGVLPSEVGNLGLYRKACKELTERDKRKIAALEARIAALDGGQEWLPEIAKLKTTGRKCELEGLTGFTPRYMTEVYLKSKINHFLNGSQLTL